MSNKICHDCNAKEGEYHYRGCDMERCPYCGCQLISCGCCYEMLSLDVSEGTWTYHNGLTTKQEEEWLSLLEEKGRVPWVQDPVLCAKCGEVFPTLFTDDEWHKYVPPTFHDRLRCRSCSNDCSRSCTATSPASKTDRSFAISCRCLREL